MRARNLPVVSKVPRISTDHRQRVLDNEGTPFSYREVKDALYPIEPQKGIEQASLVIAPTNIKQSELLVVKPTDGSGEGSYSRADNIGTIVDENGLIVDACWNFIEQSQSLDQSPWSTELASISPDTEAAPAQYPNTFADSLVITSGTHSWAYIKQNSPFDEEIYISVWVKSSDYDYFVIESGFNGSKASFDLSTNSVEFELVNANNSSIEQDGQYYLVKTRITAPSGTSIMLYTKDSAGVSKTVTGDGVKSLELFGVQFAKSDKPYLKTTDRLNIPRVNWDFEYTEGELVTNGGFDSDTDWTKDSSWSIAGGVAHYDGINHVQNLTQNLNTLSGKLYVIRFDVSNIEAGKDAFFRMQGVGAGAPLFFNYTKFSTGSYEVLYEAVEDNGGFAVVALNSSTGGYFDLDNLSVEEIALKREIADQNTIANSGNGIATKLSDNTYNATSDGTAGSTLRPKFTFDEVVDGKYYKVTVRPHNQSGTVNYSIYDGASYIVDNDPLTGVFSEFIKCEDEANFFLAFDGTQTFDIDFSVYVEEYDVGLILNSGKSSILCEPERENLVVNNTDLQSSEWVDNGSIITSGIADVFGSNNAFIIEETGNNVYIRDTFGALSDNTIHIVSVCVKKYVSNNAQFTFFVNPAPDGNPISHRFKFDFDTEILDDSLAVGNSGYIRSGFIRLKNGYFRLFCVFETGVSSVGQLQINRDFYSITDFLNTIYCYPQLTEGEYLTSIMPTSGATAIRSADQFTGFGDVNSFNSEEGVLTVMLKVFEETSGSSRFVSISDGTSSNYISIFIDTAGNLRARLQVGGVAIFTLAENNIVPTDFNLIQFQWKSGNHKLLLNGLEVDTNISATTLPANTLSQLQFAFATGISFFEGEIRYVKVDQQANL